MNVCALFCLGFVRFFILIFRFYFESERGLFPNTEFVFDLELPVDFAPVNNDGEVDEFELLPAKLAMNKIMSPDFKITSAPVVIDFFVRHGWITAETGAFKFLFSAYALFYKNFVSLRFLKEKNFCLFPSKFDFFSFCGLNLRRRRRLLNEKFKFSLINYSLFFTFKTFFLFVYFWAYLFLKNISFISVKNFFIFLIQNSHVFLMVLEFFFFKCRV